MFKKHLAIPVLLCLFLSIAFGTATASRPRAMQNVTIGTGTAASCQTQAAANALSDAVAAGGVVDFNCGPNLVTIVVNTNATDQAVTVNGAGKIALSGDNLRQIFYVFGTGNLTLNDLTLENGDFGSGGAIYLNPQARATINRSFLISNHAATQGGAIFNQGTLLINASTLGSNRTDGSGGAIYNDGGSVTIHGTYFINNQAVNGGAIHQGSGSLIVDTSAFRSHTVAGQGAGLWIAGGSVQIENTTFSNNQADRGGGIYKSNGTATLTNVTFNENRADLGAAFYNFGGAATIRNTIFTGSLDEAGTSPSLNCDGPTMTSAGRNIVSDNSCVPNPGSAGDKFSTNPLLGVWEVPGHVYRPQSTSSPAVDYGLNCPAIDQLGKPRPIGAACDVGSVEFGWWVYLPVIVR
jgi:predicted outer membrane repeat protein